MVAVKYVSMDNGFIDVWNVVVVKFVFMENSKAYVKNATVLLSAFMDVCDVDASCAAAVQFVNTTKLRFIVMNAKEVRFVNTVKANDNVNFVKATVYVCICFRNVDVRNAAVIKYVSTVNLKLLVLCVMVLTFVNQEKSLITQGVQHMETENLAVSVAIVS